jgi:hypothetical protein
MNPAACASGKSILYPNVVVSYSKALRLSVSQSGERTLTIVDGNSLEGLSSRTSNTAGNVVGFDASGHNQTK